MKMIKVAHVDEGSSIVQGMVWHTLRLLAAAILAIAKAAGEGGLLAAGEHHWTGVVMLLKGVQQGTGKAKVALHELLLVLRTVHTRQVEYKVRILTPLIQLFWSRIQVILKDSLYLEGRETTVLSFLHIAQIRAEIPPHKPFRACY